MRRDVRSDGKPFSFPGEKIIPLVALAVVLWILSHATMSEFRMAAIVLAVASVLYVLSRVRAGRRAPAGD
jgi:hypothetical protein